MSTVPFSACFTSIPRCITPTEKGYAIGLDGSLLLFEFATAQTLYMSPSQFTDASGASLRQHLNDEEVQRREDALLLPEPPPAETLSASEAYRREKARLVQAPLFERVHPIQSVAITVAAALAAKNHTDPEATRSNKENFEGETLMCRAWDDRSSVMSA
jgi:hypothetical protein